MQGIVDPISLTLVMLLGIAAVGAVTGPDAADQQLVQDTSAEAVESVKVADQHLADN